ncbi:MAG: hypothetical protein K9N35_00100 [Candidatus Marinimicrobia bacterium]|nr:hypothetical protein [Candidatus Neomarinimicrobiota bacterium]
MIKACFMAGLHLFVAQALMAQDFLSGTITYISQDNAFSDMGKKDGILVGDTVRVQRADLDLGTAIISQTSGSSSALVVQDGMDISWQIGDQVILTRPVIKNLSESGSLELDSTHISATITQVFLDSNAYRERGQRSLETSRLAPRYSGYLSARIDDRGGDPQTEGTTSGFLYGKFKIQDMGIKFLSTSVYFRASGISTEKSISSNIYSIMFQYKNPNSHFDYLGGRMYHPQFSMLGTVDGLGLTWLSKRRMVSALAGLEAPLYGSISTSRRSKMGIVDLEYFAWGNIQFGNITEIQNGDLARNYILLGSSLKLKGGIRIRGYSEYDLDPFDQSSSQSTISLTRFNASMNMRIWKSLSGNFRYNYRENVQSLLDTVDTELNLTARHALSANLSWIFKPGMSMSAQASYRSDANARNIQMYGLTMNYGNFTARSFSFNAGLLAMFSYVSEGGRVHASLGKTLLPWLDMELYDELFLYRILGETSFRTRHLPEISMAFKVPGLNRLKLRSRFEQENGDLFYRLSLSATRQF